MKLGEGKLDAWNRKALLIVCLVFLVIVIVIGWRLLVYQQEHMPKIQTSVGQLSSSA